jgi:hypothetical protein
MTLVGITFQPNVCNLNGKHIPSQTRQHSDTITPTSSPRNQHPPACGFGEQQAARKRGRPAWSTHRVLHHQAQMTGVTLPHLWRHTLAIILRHICALHFIRHGHSRSPVPYSLILADVTADDRDADQRPVKGVRGTIEPHWPKRRSGRAANPPKPQGMLAP